MAVAGAAGALGRYAIVARAARATTTATPFPWATLGINVAGSFLLGLVVTATAGRVREDVRLALGVGFLGAFTTFSTFSYETMSLLRNDRPVAAATYVAASIVLGIAAAAIGYTLGRALAAR